jgi:hypothetical protein
MGSNLNGAGVRELFKVQFETVVSVRQGVGRKSLFEKIIGLKKSLHPACPDIPFN